MKFIPAILAIAVLAISTPAHAGFGMPSLPSGGGATPEKLDAFVNDARSAEQLVRTAAWHIGAAVLNKDVMDKLSTERAAINKIEDPKEKEAKLKELDKNLNAELAKADYAKASEAEKKADAEHKKATSAAIYNYALGVLKDAQLVIDGKGLVSGVPSPAIATKLPAAKDALASITGQVDSQTKVMGGIKALASSVDLKDLPTKASDQPKPLAD